MRWMFPLAEEPPRLTPEQWQEVQQQIARQQMTEAFTSTFWLHGLIELAIVAFTIWMIVYCIRNDSDRQTWLWILLFFPLLGAGIYFFARWLPSTSFAMPTFVRRWMDSAKIRRLQAAAQQIGNPYQYIELGDAFRDVKRYSDAASAYEQALAKEPGTLPALWGLAISQAQIGRADSARSSLETILQSDPGYKFGDVSLMYGRLLQALPDREPALAHWRNHIKRWRQPEALFSLAQILAERHEYTEARQLLSQMISDIDLTPRALSRKVFFWKSRGKKLLRSIPPA